MDAIHPSPRRVAILAFPGIQLLDIAGPADAFDIASRERVAAGGSPAYAIDVIAADAGPLRASNGVRVAVDRPLGEVDPADIDTLLVAGGPGAREAAETATVRAWLREAGSRIRRIGSVCTGAFLLADAGLLRDRRAVTHWQACDELAAAHPEISVERDAIFLRQGAVWTSAGVTAGIDLALAMVEEDHGRDLALAVARLLVVFLKRPGGQSQFSAPLAAQMADHPPLRDVQHYAVADPGGDLSVEALAARAGMSPRNFARVFVRETGQTPGDFVEGVRIDAARRLLEDDRTSADRIARACGFGEPDTMRRAFLRRLGVTPRDYRARFDAGAARRDTARSSR